MLNALDYCYSSYNVIEMERRTLKINFTIYIIRKIVTFSLQQNTAMMENMTLYILNIYVIASCSVLCYIKQVRREFYNF